MLPYLTSKIEKKYQQMMSFAGLNTSPYKQDNELISCCNTSGKHYPCLGVRNKRATHIETGETINGASFYNGLFYTSKDSDTGKNYIYHGQNKTELPQTEQSDERFFAGMSDNILIMPDKVMYTVSEKEAKKLAYPQTFDIDSALEKAYQNMPGVSSTVPYGVAMLYTTHIETTSLSYGIYSYYCMSPENLKENEFVYITMDIESKKNYDDDLFKKLKDDMKKGLFVKITSLSVTHQYWLSGENYSVSAIHFKDSPIDLKGYDDIYIKSITIEKRIPDFVHICTYGNRMWGVEKNTIRCSLLGDASIWYDFSADTFGTLPSSCYSVDVDTGGEFTAICQFNGNIIAFKEDCIHKLCGNQPENFTLYTQTMKGVKKGAHNTLVEISGILYYMSTDGFYAFSGGLPQRISDKLPDGTEGISAGTDGKNYYVIAGKDGKKQILVYYPDYRIWHVENADDEFAFVNGSGKLFCASAHKITDMTHGTSDNEVNFEFTFSFDENNYFNKNYTRLLLKYSLKKGGYFKVTTTCDGNPVTSHIYGEFDCGENMESIIILPRIRCRTITVKFEGQGDFILKSLLREYFLLKEGGK